MSASRELTLLSKTAKYNSEKALATSVRALDRTAVQERNAWKGGCQEAGLCVTGEISI